MTVPKEATEFINNLMGRSPRTKLNYESFTGNFWAYVGNKKMSDVGVDDIMGFLKDGASKGWKPSTVKQYAKLARAFFGEYKDEAFMKKLKKQMRFLPPSAEHASLYEGIYVPPDKIERFISLAESEEWAVLYTMILKWGMRLGEALNMPPCDIDAKNNRVVVRGKGAGGFGKIRNVLVEKSTITRILTFAGCTREEILGEKQIRDTKPIIKNIKGRNAEYKWKETAKKAKLKNWERLTPHDGRHSYAINFLIKRKNEGMGALVLLKNQLGHSSITITQIYLDIAGAEAQDIFDAGLETSNTENVINTSEAT